MSHDTSSTNAPYGGKIEQLVKYRGETFIIGMRLKKREKAESNNFNLSNLIGTIFQLFSVVVISSYARLDRWKCLNVACVFRIFHCSVLCFII